MSYVNPPGTRTTLPILSMMKLSLGEMTSTVSLPLSLCLSVPLSIHLCLYIAISLPLLVSVSLPLLSLIHTQFLEFQGAPLPHFAACCFSIMKRASTTPGPCCPSEAGEQRRWGPDTAASTQLSHLPLLQGENSCPDPPPLFLLPASFSRTQDSPGRRQGNACLCLFTLRPPGPRRGLRHPATAPDS